MYEMGDRGVHCPAWSTSFPLLFPAHFRNQQALKRRGLPEDQAAAIAFLASDDASFITGHNIDCSGGQS